LLCRLIDANQINRSFKASQFSGLRRRHRYPETPGGRIAAASGLHLHEEERAMTAPLTFKLTHKIDDRPLVSEKVHPKERHASMEFRDDGMK
jgi:hypothetical protein